ncbi:MAG: hypothetical protein DMF00_13395 [Verrucomicrobia bacterium]|nr:MAG: hypothetical protein DMF00_13395 [Verrucomicrobiota bacterium]
MFNSHTCRILFATFLSALCLIALSTQAATITVINTNDSGAGSLRQALADTNDGDTIDFAVTGTITLTTDELLVDKSITISGPGSDNLTVDGNHASRVFHVSSGVTATVAGLSITNGGEVPGAGGGIYNDHSTLAIDHCTVSGNHGSVGGGVYNDGYSGTATLTVTNSTFSGNSVAAPYSVGSGGGIYNNGSYGSATLTVANSTFSGNSAGYLDYGWGGAIYNDGSLGSATLTLNNSTFSGNSAGYHGGGIYNGSGMVTIRHTILNAGAWGENLSNAYGSVSSLGYNLSSDNGGGFLTATGDQINTDPMLGPLQDNGGSTFTHELLSGSPAINAGDPSFTPPPDYDQRGPGFPRVVNGRIDIGAFEEVQAPIYAAQVQQPINADGTSVFSVRRGVVPVKFTLTQGGVATCALPSATIAVTRTAGGTTGQIDESVYSGSADTGSNFRIDSCQYIYNLSASALGVGTYRVDIQIDSQVVGSGIFQLK